MQKIKILISGCNGRMGQVITRMCNEAPDMEVVAGFDINADSLAGFPVFSSPAACNVKADVLIDFSNAVLLDGLLEYCLAMKLPALICSTGHSDAHLAELHTARQRMSLF